MDYDDDDFECNNLDDENYDQEGFDNSESLEKVGNVLTKENNKLNFKCSALQSP